MRRASAMLQAQPRLGADAGFGQHCRIVARLEARLGAARLFLLITVTAAAADRSFLFFFFPLFVPFVLPSFYF
jgi:hypothetical protein